VVVLHTTPFSGTLQQTSNKNNYRYRSHRCGGGRAPGGHAPQAGGGMELRGGDADAFEVLEMGRLESEDRSSWLRKAEKGRTGRPGAG